MAIPGAPTSFYVQQGNGQVLLTWSVSAGATSYSVQRSTDGITYSVLTTPSVNSYLDTSVTAGTMYWYKVASVNTDGTSAYTAAQNIVPAYAGQLSLGELRLRAQQRADRVNSNFVSMPEWNFFINQAYYELYDLLITTFEDYYVADRLVFATDGSQSYDLPNGQNYDGARPLYKLYGVDCGLDNAANAWVTLKKFDFIARNRFVYPQLNNTFLGVFNLQYRLIGNKIMFIPTPSAGQYIGLWYYPRLETLLNDSDIMESISGWDQYVIVRAAKYALDKEESDTSSLDQELIYLKGRIEESAMNRDAGQADTISPTRSWSDRWGGMAGGIGFDGPWGGY